MNRAAISLSFDDGRGDNKDIFESILIPMSIPATLNVTTGYVDGSCPVEYVPTAKQAVCIRDVQKLAESPLVEIALHGDFHMNTEDDIALGREKMISWLDYPDDHVFGFASPGSGLPVEDFINSSSVFFCNHISYLRTSLRIKNHSWLRVLCRKAGRILHIPYMYRIAYADTLMSDCPDRVIYSVPILKDTTLAQVKAIVNLAIDRRSALTLMFHSVVEDVSGEDNWSWERQKFVQLCEYLDEERSKGRLDILTTQQLTSLLRGR